MKRTILGIKLDLCAALHPVVPVSFMCLNLKLYSPPPCPFSNSSVPPVAEWAVPQSSRLKYRQLFNSHDKTMSGHLTGIEAVFVVSFFRTVEGLL